MRPSISTKALTDGDVVVLFSDGAWDSVQKPEILAQFVSSTVLVNPQIIADELMKLVLSQCQYQPKDDVTIVVARIGQ